MNHLASLRCWFRKFHVAGPWQVAYAGHVINLEEKRCIDCARIVEYRDVNVDGTTTRSLMSDPTTEAESWKVRKL